MKQLGVLFIIVFFMIIPACDFTDQAENDIVVNIVGPQEPVLLDGLGFGYNDFGIPFRIYYDIYVLLALDIRTEAGSYYTDYEIARATQLSIHLFLERDDLTYENSFSIPIDFFIPPGQTVTFPIKLMQANTVAELLDYFLVKISLMVSNRVN